MQGNRIERAHPNGTARRKAVAALLLIVAVAWMAVAPRHVRAQSGEAIALEVSEVMELAGIDTALDQIPALVNAQIETRRVQIDEGVVRRLEQAMLEAFAPALLKADARKEMAKHYHPTVFEKGLLWLRSPMGRLFTAMEVDAGKPESDALLGGYVKSLGEDPPKRERLVLVSNIIRATETLKTVIDMLVIVAEPILHTVNALAPEGEQRNPDQVEAMLAVMRDTLEDPMGKQVMVRSMFAYRNATDEQLEVYFSFLKSDEGQALYEAINAGIVSALHKGSERVAVQLETVLGPQPTESAQ